MLFFLFFCLLTVVMGALVNHFCSRYLFACPACKTREAEDILAKNSRPLASESVEDAMDNLLN
jgi:hypothetical protein